MHQRAVGRVSVSFKRRGALSVLDRLGQEGCLKARFPRGSSGGGAEAVLLNCSGGVAGGDRLEVAVAAGAGTRALVSTQAAERHYRAVPGSVAQVATRLEVAAGAGLEWLPQETILFDGCALRRRLEVDLAEDAAFLGVESLVFGRAASGEVVRRAMLDDLIAVRVGGRLMLHDRVRLGGDVGSVLARRAVAAGGRAVATIIAAGKVAGAEAVRAALAPFDAGVSAVDGLVVARVVAEDGACLRRAVVAGLGAFRDGLALPRVWSC